MNDGRTRGIVPPTAVFWILAVGGSTCVVAGGVALIAGSFHDGFPLLFGGFFLVMALIQGVNLRTRRLYEWDWRRPYEFEPGTGRSGGPIGFLFMVILGLWVLTWPL